MSSSSVAAQARAGLILAALNARPLPLLPELQPGTATAVQFDSDLEFLHALRLSAPASMGLVFLDLPRASRRQKFQAPALDGDNQLTTISTAWDDPNYRFRLAIANHAFVRMAREACASDGLIVAIASPDTYMEVRGALDTQLGSNCFVGEAVYQKKASGMDNKKMVMDHETLLIYARQHDKAASLRRPKTDEEIAAYNEECPHCHELSQWDTFRSKNGHAYPIQVPDGPLLELDEHGNPIKWKLVEKTFKADLEMQHIKFLQTGKNQDWTVHRRLFLKDDHKPFRSLVFTGDELKEGRGAILMTKAGTDEINAYGGAKPRFAKGSDYWAHFFNLLAPAAEPIAVIGGETGASVVGFLRSEARNRGSSLVMRFPPEYSDLLSWRLQQVENDLRETVSVVAPEHVTLDALLEAGDDSRSALLSLLGTRHVLLEDWFALRKEGVAVDVSRTASEVIMLLTDAALGDRETPPLLSDLLADADVSVDGPVILYSPFSADRLAPFLGNGVNRWALRQVPQCFYL